MDNIDFERAVARKLELNKFMKYSPQTLEPGRNASSSRLQWNFKMLDLVVGRGTTANNIFELKSTGAFKGAKRKLRFPCEESYKPYS